MTVTKPEAGAVERPSDGEMRSQALSAWTAGRVIGILPIVAFVGIAAMVIISGVRTVFEPFWLLPAMNTTFLSVLPMMVAFVAAQAWVRGGPLTLLMFACGSLTLSLGASAAGWLITSAAGPNATVTVYNTCAMLSAAFHFVGVVLTILGVIGRGRLTHRRVGVLVAAVVIALFVGVLTLATVRGLTPRFFVQGTGARLPNVAVLSSAVTLFVVSGGLLAALYGRTRNGFFYWYFPAMILFALGLICVLLQGSVGSLLGWTGRAAQYTGGVYFLLAILAAGREARGADRGLDSVLSGLFLRHVDQLVDERTVELIRVNQQLHREISERKRADEEIASLARFPRESPNPVFRVSGDGTILLCNEAALPLLKAWRCAAGSRLPEEPRRMVLDALDSGQGREIEVQDCDRTFIVTLAPVVEAGYVNIYGLDITDRKRAEKQIAVSLKEKDALLREVHHRVKNNLQVVVSLLRLQARRIDDAPEAVDVFRECESRVRAMALVHETLYRSGNLASVDASQYVARLCDTIARMYGGGQRRINLTAHSQEVHLSMERAVPVGLIIGELVSNAFKHAFPDGREGSIVVELRQGADDQVELTVQDDGVGLSPETDPADSVTIGLSLVIETVSGQLGGSIEFDRSRGVGVKIRFKAQNAGPEAGI